jgi:hypothetical protein
MLNWLISSKSMVGTHCTGGCSLNGCCVEYLVVVIFNMIVYSVCGHRLTWPVAYLVVTPPVRGVQHALGSHFGALGWGA